MNVLVTRPNVRGQQLVEMLAQHHIFAIHQPLFQMEAGRELPALPSALTRLNAGDYVFAVSKNAIDFAHNTLVQTGFSWRSDLKYFAVGQGSANYFSAQIEQNIIYPIQSEDSESLLALPEMQQLTDKNILILRADSGRELFSEQAQKRGAQVQTLECYQRIPVDVDLKEQISLCKRAGIDVVVATSGEILTALVSNTAEEDKAWLLSCKLIVVSQRLARIAVKLGWRLADIQISNKADNNSLLQTLLANQES